MSSMTRAATLLVVLAAVAARADETAGPMRFKLPAGWHRADQDGVTVLAPDGVSGVGIAVYRDQPRRGDLAAWFKARVAEGQAGVKVVGATEPKTAHGDGYDLVVAGARVTEKDGHDSFRAYVAAAARDRFVFAVYYGASQELFQAHQQAFDGWLASITFPAPFAPPGPGDGGLDGFFAGTATVSGFDAQSKMWRSRSVPHEYFLAPSGWIYWGRPEPSPDDVDFAQAVAAHPDWVGVYRLAGARIAIRWGDGKATELERVAGDHLREGKVELWKAARLVDYRLDGTYGFTTYVDTSGAGTTGGVSGEHTITFTRDGRFTTTDVTGFVGGGAEAQAAGSGRGGGAGSYRIHGYTIELDSGRARTKKMFFLYSGDEKKPRPGIIEMGGASYLLR
jgi:hypothetical protein